MPIYRYKAQDKLGRVINSVVEYDSEERLSTDLEKVGLYVITIKDVTGKRSKIADLVERFKGISSSDLIIFTRQLSTMINSGLSLIDSLSGVLRQTQNRKLKAIIEMLIERIRAGDSFSQALSVYSFVFGEMYVNMVRAGEEGGILGSILERLSVLAVHEAEVKSKIRAAVTYPLIIIIMAMLIVTFLLIFVMPRFINIFEAAGTALPWPTKILLAISSLLRYRWYIFLLLLVTGGLGFRAWFRTEKGRFKVDQIILNLPVVGSLYLKILVSRFTRLLGSLCKSGVPLLYSIEVVGKTINNMVLSQVISGSKKGISEGQSLSDPLKLSGIFPPMVIQMIAAGEKTGKLDQMLTEISNFYDVEIEYSIRNLTSLVEPAMIIIMGLIVGFIALSVLLPIFNLVKLFR